MTKGLHRYQLAVYPPATFGAVLSVVAGLALILLGPWYGIAFGAFLLALTGYAFLIGLIRPQEAWFESEQLAVRVGLGPPMRFKYADIASVDIKKLDLGPFTGLLRAVSWQIGARAVDDLAVLTLRRATSNFLLNPYPQVQFGKYRHVPAREPTAFLNELQARITANGGPN